MSQEQQERLSSWRIRRKYWCIHSAGIYIGYGPIDFVKWRLATLSICSESPDGR